ncbi:zinc finger protein 501-like [Ornithodoros turicata]|uniref:zinc finger protein 501-like n=1 Tax=Ornithodoros turicata TaxID=34597 RepID=UPI003138FDF4
MVQLHFNGFYFWLTKKKEKRNVAFYIEHLFGRSSSSSYLYDLNNFGICRLDFYSQRPAEAGSKRRLFSSIIKQDVQSSPDVDRPTSPPGGDNIRAALVITEFTQPWLSHECKGNTKKQAPQANYEATDRNRFKCQYCTYTTPYRSKLPVHERVHTGEQPYQCSICAKVFSRKDNLNEHLRFHTGEKPFACEHCERKFSHKSDLTKHRRCHTGEKPYGCPICHKMFAHKGNMLDHQRTHTGERPFRCSFCTYSCGYKRDLNRHIQTHMGEKYACVRCPKMFSRPHLLRQHENVHHGMMLQIDGSQQPVGIDYEHLQHSSAV